MHCGKRVVILVDECAFLLARKRLHSRGIVIEVVSVREQLSKGVADDLIAHWMIAKAERGVCVIFLTRDSGFAEQLHLLRQERLHVLCIERDTLPIHLFYLEALGSVLRRDQIIQGLTRQVVTAFGAPLRSAAHHLLHVA